MIPGADIVALVRAALAEDAPSGDPFGEGLSSRATGRFIAGSDGVFCGGEVATEAFRQVDRSCVVSFVSDGTRVRRGDSVGTVSGPAFALLLAERVALNFLQKMGGVATVTARFVDAVAPFGTKILDTRKTTPLLRALEKYAVRVGGGTNHRSGLSDGILIKENGIRVAGGVTVAIAHAKSRAHHLLRVEVEAETLEQVAEAVVAGADAVLLDNMSPSMVAEALSRFGADLFLEASGGITLANVVEFAKTGVHAVSIGALTHSAPALDLSFEIDG